MMPFLSLCPLALLVVAGMVVGRVFGEDPGLTLAEPRATSFFRKNVEKRWLLENMDGAFLVLDEIVDGG